MINENEKLYACAGKICRDTREIQKGQVYIAIRGDNFNGHDFVKEAIDKGAELAIVDHEIPDVDKEKLIIVDDTLKALGDIAKNNRQKTAVKIIAVTGSSGKTSTKEMLKTAFQNQANVYATVGNLNSTLGMPLTLANMPKDTEIAILEMGMNHSGEIAQMTDIANPDTVIITNIGNAHHEFFPTSLDIAKAKGEIFQGMGKDGSAFIYNGEFFNFLSDKAKEHIENVVSFGDIGDVKLLGYENGKCEIELLSCKYSYQIKLKGKHQAMNSLAVLAVVENMGKSVDKAIEGLEKMQPIKGRGETFNINYKDSEITLIDDAYNANPDSMKAAIVALNEFSGQRKIAVLGEMRELGEKAEQFHKDLLPSLLSSNVDKVFCCCSGMKFLYDILPPEKQGGWAENSKELWNIFKNNINEKDIILVKGSLGSNMLYIVDCIKSIK